MSVNDIFYLLAVSNIVLGLGTQILLALAIYRFTAMHRKPEQDQ